MAAVRSMIDRRSSPGRVRDARSSLVRAAKATCATVLCASGTRRAVKALSGAARGGPRLLVPMYHLPTAGAPHREPRLLQSLCVSRPTLRRQLQDLAREREIVSLDEACRRMAEADLRPTAGPRVDCAVVTFDDGYVGVWEEALPVLRELRIPAVVYVATGYVGTSRRLLHDRLHASLGHLQRLDAERAVDGLSAAARAVLASCWRPTVPDTLSALIATTPHDDLAALAAELERRLGLAESDLPRETRILSWDQLRELQASGVDVAGHTVNHVALVNVPLGRAASEVRGCRDDIARNLGAPPRHFSYPNCYFSPAIRKVVADAGFATAVTGAQRAAGPFDPYAIPRRSVCEDSTRGLVGYSSALARCHFDGVFAALRLRRSAGFERDDALVA
jgi:peptidoglycan/xylan/chitin deacetylase (PgdA/CDA1 family)